MKKNRKTPSPASTSAAMPASLQNFDKLPDSAHVRLPCVCALYGYSPATVWRKVKEKKMPAPKKPSERIRGWQVGELRTDLAARHA